MENPNVQYYVVNQNASYDSKKFKYKIEDIQVESFSNQFRDEEMRDTLLKNDMKNMMKKKKIYYMIYHC